MGGNVFGNVFLNEKGYNLFLRCGKANTGVNLRASPLAYTL